MPCRRDCGAPGFPAAPWGASSLDGAFQRGCKLLLAAQPKGNVVTASFAPASGSCRAKGAGTVRPHRRHTCDISARVQCSDPRKRSLTAPRSRLCVTGTTVPQHEAHRRPCRHPRCFPPRLLPGPCPSDGQKPPVFLPEPAHGQFTPICSCPTVLQLQQLATNGALFSALKAEGKGGPRSALATAPAPAPPARQLLSPPQPTPLCCWQVRGLHLCLGNSQVPRCVEPAWRCDIRPDGT